MAKDPMEIEIHSYSTLWGWGEYYDRKYHGWGNPFIVKHSRKNHYYVIRGVSAGEMTNFTFCDSRSYQCLAGPFNAFEPAAVAYKLLHPGPRP
jgi:hypothetical protein